MALRTASSCGTSTHWPTSHPPTTLLLVGREGEWRERREGRGGEEREGRGGERGGRGGDQRGGRGERKEGKGKGESLYLAIDFVPAHAHHIRVVEEVL